MFDQALISHTYGLNWAGKSEAWSQAGTPLAREHLTENGLKNPVLTSSDNILIEGENLCGLKLLAKEYGGKVGLIYIDPPYNTGNDFGYSDNYRLGVRSIASSAGTAPATFSAESERLHSRWLSMMLPRLLLARKFLRDDGLICVSIDDNEVDKLRLLMAEVFGEKNFMGQITILSNPRGRQAERHFATVHEYLLVFGKNAAKSRLPGVALTEEQAKEFRSCDESGRRFRLLGLRQRGAASRQEDRPALHYPIYVDPASRRVSLQQTAQFSEVAWPKKSTGQPGRWMWGKDKLSTELEIVEAKFIERRGEWDVFVRDFLCDQEGTMRTRKLSTIWTDAELNYQNGKRQLKSLVGEAPVDYPKPVALIKRAIGLVDDPAALVMDFFAGTGTTAQSVMEQNVIDGGTRKFILIQAPEPLKASNRFATISHLCIERVKEASLAGGLAGPLRVLKIDQ